MYEGEYFNGKRNGKGKDYYYNGNIKYEGDYKKGKRHGEGYKYDKTGSIIYIGEFKDGKRNLKNYFFLGKQIIYNYKILKFINNYFNS